MQSVHSLIQGADTGDMGIFYRIQGIQTEIEPLYTCRLQRLSQLGKQGAIGSDANLLDAFHSGGLFADGEDVLLHQRFPAGDAQLGNVQRSSHFHCLQHFFFRQHRFVGLFANTILRHAVTAAQIAFIRYREPQIMDLSTVTVNHS